MSSLFYMGPDTHVCRLCGARFELADPALDRRAGSERRVEEADVFGEADWRSGFDRRFGTTA